MLSNEKIIHCVLRDSFRKEIKKFKIGNKIKLFYNPLTIRILENE